MTAIYFGAPVAPHQKASATLVARDLQLVKAPIDSLYPCGIPLMEQPHFNVYRYNLPAYIRAAQSGSKTRIDAPGYPISESNSLFPLPSLSVMTSFNNRNPAREVLEYITALGYNRLENKGRVSFIINNITVEAAINLVTRMKAERDSYVSVPSVTSFGGASTIWLVRKIFSAFLRLHQYPSFWYEEDETKTVMSLKKEVLSLVKEKAGSKSLRDEDETIGSSSKRPRDDSGEGEVHMDIGEAPPPTDEPAPVQPPEVMYAFAKPNKLSDGWGPISKIPNTSGLYVAFLEEIAGDDIALVPALIQQYFFKCLGGDPLACGSSMYQLHAGWSSAHRTLCGKVLSHIASGIRFAMQTQCRVWPIFEGEDYLGYVLSGAKFAVTVGGVVHNPSTHSEVRLAIQSAKTQYFVLREVVQKVNDLLAKYDSSDVIDEMDLKSVRQIHKAFSGIELLETDKKHLLEWSESLRFEDAGWIVSKSNVVSFLEMLAMERDIEETDPMAPRAVLNYDPIVEALSVFGNLAPSPLIPSGVKINILDDGPFTTSRTDKAMLAMPLVPIIQAAAEWKSFLSSGFITNSPTERASSSKYRTWAGSDKLEIILNMRKAREATLKSKVVEERAVPLRINKIVGGEVFDF